MLAGLARRCFWTRAGSPGVPQLPPLGRDVQVELRRCTSAWLEMQLCLQAFKHDIAL